MKLLENAFLFSNFFSMKNRYTPITVDFILQQLEAVQKSLDNSIKRVETACNKALREIKRSRAEKGAQI